MDARTTTGTAVHVGPHEQDTLREAVVAGGGRPVPLEQAEAIVYWGADTPDEVAAMVHPGIRWVQLPHAGVDAYVDAGVITPEQVWTSATGAFAPQVAEHAMALMLAGARGLPELARARTWDQQGARRSGRALAGTTVALLGAGGIGAELVRLLEPFGCTVLAVADSGPFAGATRTVARADYRDVLPLADFVVLLAPSTPATRGMVGQHELALMKDDAWLVNVARGPLVDTDALVAALRDGAIGGAALDVVDPEPLPDGHPLWSEPRALVTPHSANPLDAYWPTLAARVQDNVRRFVAGEPLVGVVDLARGF